MVWWWSLTQARDHDDALATERDRHARRAHLSPAADHAQLDKRAAPLHRRGPLSALVPDVLFQNLPQNPYVSRVNDTLEGLAEKAT